MTNLDKPTDSGLKAEILPCPFCGAVPIEARGFVGSEWVECSNQNCAIVSRAIFLKDWNTRPSAPADEAVKALTEVRPKRPAINGYTYPAQIDKLINHADEMDTYADHLEAKLNGGK